MKIKAKRFESALSNIFFFFLTAQIFSPYFSGVTLYLEGVLPLINPFFLAWIYKRDFSAKRVAVLLFCVGVASVLHMDLVIKAALMMSVVCFMIYAYERGIFYLYRYFALSIILALAQFVLVFADPELARTIGPKELSTAVWGANATPTYTNFYAILLYPRVSGLSREAGFLASYVCAVAVLCAADFTFRKKSIYRNIAVGWMLSLSKISFVIFPALIVVRLKRFINYVPLPATFLIAYLVLSSLGHYVIGFALDGNIETVIHRFGGYIILDDISAGQFFWGVDNVAALDSSIVYALDGKIDNMAGLGGFLVRYGMISVILWLTAIWAIGIRSSGLLIIILLSIGVNPMANQNFVVVAYFIAAYILPRAASVAASMPATPRRRKFVFRFG